MGGPNEVARRLLHQEPGPWCHREHSDDTSNLAKKRAQRQHHETADDYLGLVAQFDERWRVIVCKDGIQWILQRRDAERSGQPRWKAVSMSQTRDALIRVSRTKIGVLVPNVIAVLDRLPRHIANKIGTEGE